MRLMMTPSGFAAAGFGALALVSPVLRQTLKSTCDILLSVQPYVLLSP